MKFERDGTINFQEVTEDGAICVVGGYRSRCAREESEFCLFPFFRKILQYSQVLFYVQVWEGLPSPESCQDPAKFAAALLTIDHILEGFGELSESNQRIFISHCRDCSNWVAYRKPKKPLPATAAAKTEDEETVPPTAAAAPDGSLVPSSEALVPGRQKFVVPQPGVNGASGNTVFSGKTFVLAGIFPEIEGGQRLSLGKDRVKLMIETFGGRVTGSISGRTDVLIVGKEAGMSKVADARVRPNVILATLKDLKDGLDAGFESLKKFDFFNREEPLKIKSFSAGYKFNGKALEASKEEMEVAQGVKKATPKAVGKKAPPTKALTIEDDPKPAAQPSLSENAKLSRTRLPARTTRMVSNRFPRSAKSLFDPSRMPITLVARPPLTLKSRRKRKIQGQKD